MKRGVIDASSAILLFKAGLFEDLIGAYQIVLARSVYQEISRSGYPGARSFRRYWVHHQVEVSSVNRPKKMPPDHAAALSALGKGEKETILLFLCGAGDFIIIDDGRGAGFCRDHRIPYINSLLVARILLLSRMISEDVFQKKIEMLTRLGRYSQKIIDYAATCPSQEMALFMPAFVLGISAEARRLPYRQQALLCHQVRSDFAPAVSGEAQHEKRLYHLHHSVCGRDGSRSDGRLPQPEVQGHGYRQ